MSQKDQDIDEKSGCEQTCDNIRYVFSTVLTLAAITVIVYAIGRNYAALPGHPAVHYPLLVGVLTLLAYLEGLQVAILALERVDRNTFSERRKAWVCHRLATANKGRNVQRFLIGRQFFVVFVVFLCAQLTTYTKMQPELASLPKIVFVLIIETGFPGALIVLAFGQLMPQLVAATHPITFMALPGSWSVIQLCLSFESTGVAHFAWVLASMLRCVFNMGDKEDITVSVKETSRKDHRSIPVEEKCSDETKSYDRKFENYISKENIYTNEIMDPEELFASAEYGLEFAASALTEKNTIIWLHNNIIQQHYGGTPDYLPMPATIAHHLSSNGKQIPRYLLPPSHPLHIPPHIVCYELLRREDCRRKHHAGGQMQLEADSSPNNTDQYTA